MHYLLFPFIRNYTYNSLKFLRPNLLVRFPFMTSRPLQRRGGTQVVLHILRDIPTIRTKAVLALVACDSVIMITADSID